jgi:hypothetical protein
MALEPVGPNAALEEEEGANPELADMTHAGRCRRGEHQAEPVLCLRLQWDRRDLIRAGLDAQGFTSESPA